MQQFPPLKDFEVVLCPMSFFVQCISESPNPFPFAASLRADFCRTRRPNKTKSSGSVSERYFQTWQLLQRSTVRRLLPPHSTYYVVQLSNIHNKQSLKLYRVKRTWSTLTNRSFNGNSRFHAGGSSNMEPILRNAETHGHRCLILRRSNLVSHLQLPDEPGNKEPVAKEVLSR